MSETKMSEIIYEARIKSVENSGNTISGVYVTFDNGKEGFISSSHLKLKNKQKNMFNSGQIPNSLLPNSTINVKLLRSSKDGLFNDLIMI